MKKGDFVGVGTIPFTDKEIDLINEAMSKNHFGLFTMAIYLDKAGIVQDGSRTYQLNLSGYRPMKDLDNNTSIPLRHVVIVRKNVDKDNNIQFSSNITLFGWFHKYRSKTKWDYTELKNCYTYNTDLSTLLGEIITVYWKHCDSYLYNY